MVTERTSAAPSAPLTAAVLDSMASRRSEITESLARAGYSVLMAEALSLESERRCKELAPSFVFVGAGHPIGRAANAIERVAGLDRTTVVGVVADPEDLATTREVVRAGARAVVGMPLRREDLEALRDRGRSRPTTHAGRGLAIAVVGQKGGIGKTSIATNLATALAMADFGSVLIIDFDTAFGDVTLALNSQVDPTDWQELPATTVAAAAVALDITPAELRQMARPHVSGASMLGASASMDEWNAVGSRQLEALVAVATQAFDFVVVDTPGALTPAVVSGMLAADIVLIVTSLEFASAKNTGLPLEVLEHEEFPLERVQVVANHTMPDTGLDVLDLVPSLNRSSIWSVPYDRQLLRGSQEGIPVVMLAPGSPAARSLLALAERLSSDPRRIDRRSAARTARVPKLQDRLRSAIARLAAKQAAA